MEYLANNIRSLREMWGESQGELGDAIGVKNTAISNYENGNRKVKPDVRTRIAEHYMVTEDVLIHSDLSELPQIQLEGKKISDITSGFFSIIPAIHSDGALEDKNFRCGYNIDVNCFQMGRVKEANIEKMGEDMFGFYAKAYGNGVIDAGVNVLNYLLSGVVHIRVTGQLEPYYCFSDTTDLRFAFNNGLLKQFDLGIDDEDENLDFEMIEYIKGVDSFTCEIIRKLREQERFELSEYLMALRYFCGTIGTNENYSSVMNVGAEMLKSLFEFENPYVLEILYKIYENFFEK